MSEIPEIADPPDQFNSEKEANQYIEQLHEFVDSWEEELEKSESEKLELEEELNEIKDHVLASTEELEDIHTGLEEVIQRMESVELHGGPIDVGLQDSLRNPDFGGN
jgi:septation ring formation regulator EzrA